MTTLTISFIGLNLFVADTATDTLHVLMPDTTGRASMRRAHDPHHAALRYVDPVAPGSAKTVRVSDTTIELPTTRTTVSSPFQQGIVNISEFWDPKRKVLPSLLTRELDLRLKGHIIIPGGRVTAITPFGIHAVKLPHTSTPTELAFAPEIICTAELPGTTLDLPKTVVRGVAAGTLDTLTSNGGEIRLLGLHLEDDELTIPPNCPIASAGAKSDHFPCYFQLFGTDNGPDLFFSRVEPPDAPICLPDIGTFLSRGAPFIRALRQHGQVSTASALQPAIGVTPFTCMGGGGEPGP